MLRFLLSWPGNVRIDYLLGAVHPSVTSRLDSVSFSFLVNVHVLLKKCARKIISSFLIYFYRPSVPKKIVSSIPRPFP